MSKPHVHAGLIMAYAKLAQETDKPWGYFEYSFDGEPEHLYWEPCKKEILFNKDTLYRLKPRTIRIREYVVPEPVRNESEINDGEFYHVPYFLNGFADTYRCVWVRNDHDIERLRNGLIHKDKESAHLHAKALISLTQK
ncbi:hypothetical protein PSI22_18705 [Xenorhabdus sp. XENO-7]|uniref:Uncharacterized protein n=1 Tax=Xenorhabdus aichiensis TaxID=3025874 RepID=A0ABT5M7W9_9GAMM|nr:hypothetical protein [Xenorhabdus aichiensis]MDC9623612.1 hypothetical protein [Xenorhabdus aichiensis]